MKKTRKILSVVLALVMVLALGTTALAADVQGLGGSAIPPTDSADCASYEVTATTPATSINVTFIMEAADNYDTDAPAFHIERTVNLTSAEAKSFTVSDLLNKVDTTDTALSFTIETSSKTGNQNLTNVTYNDENYEMEDLGMAGWEFRINDKFPVEEDPTYSWIGATINQTYLNDGDVVHFFWDNPVTVYGTNYSTNYIRLVPTVAGNSVTVQLQSQTVHIDSATLVMNVYNYADFTTPTVVTVYDANGTEVTHATTNASGAVNFSGLAAGNYTIKSASAVVDDPDDLYYDYLLTQTTGYKTIVIG